MPSSRKGSKHNLLSFHTQYKKYLTMKEESLSEMSYKKNILMLTLKSVGSFKFGG